MQRLAQIPTVKVTTSVSILGRMPWWAGPAMAVVASLPAVHAQAGAEPPVVAVATPDEGPAPLTVTLDATQSQASGLQTPVTYRWYMGNGDVLVSDAPVTEYTYSEPAGWTITLEVEDELEFVGAAKVSVSVWDDAAIPPAASIEAETPSGPAPWTVHFACACTGAGGSSSLTSYEWLLGDGHSVGTTMASLTHTFVEPGSYRIRLAVEDDIGLWAYDSTVVEALPSDGKRPPRARVLAPMTAVEQDEVVLVADADDPDGVVVALRWQFSDGTTSEGSTVTRVFGEPGFYSVQLEVEDNDGLLGHDHYMVRVPRSPPLPPHIVSSPNLTATAGNSYRYDDDDKPEATGSRPMTWSVGAVQDGAVQSAPPGLAMDHITGEIHWTPTTDQLGPQPISITVENQAGLDRQDFVVEVSSADDKRAADGGHSGGLCSTGGFGPVMVLLLLLLSGLRRFQRA